MTRPWHTELSLEKRSTCVIGIHSLQYGQTALRLPPQCSYLQRLFQKFRFWSFSCVIGIHSLQYGQTALRLPPHCYYLQRLLQGFLPFLHALRLDFVISRKTMILRLDHVFPRKIVAFCAFCVCVRFRFNTNSRHFACDATRPGHFEENYDLKIRPRFSTRFRWFLRLSHLCEITF